MELLYTAIEAALKAGREILAIYEDPNADFHVERKADNSPLTIADRRSHDVIAAALVYLFQNGGVEGVDGIVPTVVLIGKAFFGGVGKVLLHDEGHLLLCILHQ